MIVTTDDEIFFKDDTYNVTLYSNEEGIKSIVIFPDKVNISELEQMVLQEQLQIKIIAFAKQYNIPIDHDCIHSAFNNMMHVKSFVVFTRFGICKDCEGYSECGLCGAIAASMSICQNCLQISAETAIKSSVPIEILRKSKLLHQSMINEIPDKNKPTPLMDKICESLHLILCLIADLESFALNVKVEELTKICSWCSKVVSIGGRKITHILCENCNQELQKEIDAFQKTIDIKNQAAAKGGCEDGGEVGPSSSVKLVKKGDEM